MLCPLLATDSLYGSRHLAERWDNQEYTVKSNLGFCQVIYLVKLLYCLLNSPPVAELHDINTAHLMDDVPYVYNNCNS